jgi:hypothetical protein
MSILENNKKSLKILAITWIGSLVLSVLVYMLVLEPQNRSRKNLESKLVEQRQGYELARKAAMEETRARLTEQIDTLRNKLKTFVIDSQDVANLTFDISRIAQEKKVASLSVEHKYKADVSEEEDSKNISEKHIDISFITDFSQFFAFLNALERHQPVLFINQFTLSQLSQNKSAYQVTIDVAALVKKQQEDKASAQSLPDATVRQKDEQQASVPKI